MAHEQARPQLAEFFAESSGSTANSRWDALWARGDFLPWDRKTHQPALEDVLQSRPDLVGAPRREDGTRKKALVPGCGGGYDVLLLASHGWDAYGLEVSTHAVKAAESYQREHFKDYLDQSKSHDAGVAKFIHGDFFENDWLAQIEAGSMGFDLIFDYTFLCALAPAVRPDWAQRHAELLSKSQDACLICVEFPSAKPPTAGGPPFGVNSSVYDSHLGAPGQKLTYGSDGYPDKTSSSVLQPSSQGLSLVTRFQPSRTHPVGKGPDGQVTDMVSVWTHSA